MGYHDHTACPQAGGETADPFYFHPVLKNLLQFAFSQNMPFLIRHQRYRRRGADACALRSTVYPRSRPSCCAHLSAHGPRLRLFAHLRSHLRSTHSPCWGACRNPTATRPKPNRNPLHGPCSPVRAPFTLPPTGCASKAWVQYCQRTAACHLSPRGGKLADECSHQPRRPMPPATAPTPP